MLSLYVLCRLKFITGNDIWIEAHCWFKLVWGCSSNSNKFHWIVLKAVDGKKEPMADTLCLLWHCGFKKVKVSGQLCKNQIYLYTVSRCRTRGESEDHTSEKAHKGSTLALKPRADVTRSPKHGYQWHHEKDLCPQEILKKGKKNHIACKTSKSLEAFGTLTKSAWLNNNSILGIVNRNLQESLETQSILVYR